MNTSYKTSEHLIYAEPKDSESTEKDLTPNTIQYQGLLWPSGGSDLIRDKCPLDIPSWGQGPGPCLADQSPGVG